MGETDRLYRQLVTWIESDPWRMQALHSVSELGLDDWCIAAGFVRNLAWDHLHGYTRPTPLNDLDVIYFDAENITRDSDTEFEQRLLAAVPYPWSVKNQARMHARNGDKPYRDTAHAMSYWVELETAVGASLDGNNVQLVAPFGLEPLFRNTITINSWKEKPGDFHRRICEKRWLELWPRLRVAG